MLKSPLMMMGITANERPGLWGFFICVILVGIISLVRVFWTQRITTHWPEMLAERELSIQSICRREFDARAHGLLGIATVIAEDTTLFRNLFQNDPAAVHLAFEQLHSKRSSEELTYEITDARGTVLCWSGKSIGSDYDSLLQGSAGDTLVVLSQSGLYTHLTVGISAVQKRAYVFVSRPLVVNYPISNRFVQRSSFTDDLAALVKTDVRLLTKSEFLTEQKAGVHSVPLAGFDGSPVGSILFEEPQLDAVLQETNLAFDKLLGLFVGLATLGFMSAALARIKRLDSTWIRNVVVVAILWLVRSLWLIFEFPSRIIGGDLFNPSIYSTSFGFGAANSVGETFLSIVMLVAPLALWVRTLYRWIHRRDGPMAWTLHSGASVRAVVFVVASIALLWITRAYGASIRSFVVDSSIQYYDPLTTVPTLIVLVMQFNILLVTAAFVVLTFLVSVVGAQIARSFLNGGRKMDVLIPPLLVFLTFIAFQSLNTQPIVPWYYSLLILLGGFWAADFLAEMDVDEFSRRIMSVGGVTSLLICSCLIILAVTDDQIHKKEREQAQGYAQELLRPLDSWISFVLSDGLNRIGTSLAEQLSPGPLRNEKGKNLAFSFWSKTLLSREGYNSAVVVYDDKNKELSRFSVGLNAYEQREILTKVVESEEETVVALDRTGPLGASKSYGLWSTIRNESGRIIGSIALVLSASEKSMFGGEENEALRTGTTNILQNVYRPTTVSIFENGRLTATTHEELSPENVIPANVQKMFSEGHDDFIWTVEEAGGKEYESLYARDPSVKGKIVEVGLESTDYRWHIFNFLKLLSAAILAFILIAVVYAWESVRNEGSMKITFRTKLLVSFLVLGFLPLILLGYYNRIFTAQSFDQEVRKTLVKNLDLISQRILGAVSDEEDYLKGINDDFAAAVSSDLGVDFTVYRRSEVQANSRPELFETSILDSRLPGRVFGEVVLLGKQFITEDEIIGSVRYAVGYKPLYLQNRLVGVLSVPAPYRQRDIEEELARRNAYYVAVYAIIIAFIMITGWGIANQLSTPVRELTAAARDIGKGNFDVHVAQRSSDEIGELVRSFDQMVDEIKTSRISLAAAERKLAWTEMAKQVAHEIKNPLTPMKLSIQHLRQAFKDKAKDLPAIVDRTTQLIIDQIDALSRIAAEFSHYARMPEKRFERISLDETILECVELFSSVNGIEFRVKFDDTHSHIIADKDELRRVFINVIRNSVQAMERGGTITIESLRIDNTCLIRFKDSGEGIPEGLLSKVFEPNFSTKTDGTGLGLAISQKIIQDLNGTISIASSLGKGTTLEIRLPV